MSKLARYSWKFLGFGFLPWIPFLGFLGWLLVGMHFPNWTVVGLFFLSGYLAVCGSGLLWLISLIMGVLAARDDKKVLYWTLPHMILVLAGASALVIWLNLN